MQEVKGHLDFFIEMMCRKDYHQRITVNQALDEIKKIRKVFLNENGKP